MAIHIHSTIKLTIRKCSETQAKISKVNTSLKLSFSYSFPKHPAILLLYTDTSMSSCVSFTLFMNINPFNKINRDYSGITTNTKVAWAIDTKIHTTQPTAHGKSILWIFSKITQAYSQYCCYLPHNYLRKSLNLYE